MRLAADEPNTLANEPALNLGFALGLRTRAGQRYEVRLAIAPFLALRRFAMPMGLPTLSVLEFNWLEPAQQKERKETPVRASTITGPAVSSSTPVSTTTQPGSLPAERPSNTIVRELVERELTVQRSEIKLPAVQAPTGSHPVVERPTQAILASATVAPGVVSQLKAAERPYPAVTVGVGREPLSMAFALGLRPDPSCNVSAIRAWCAALASLDVRRQPTCAAAPVLSLTLVEGAAPQLSDRMANADAPTEESPRSVSANDSASQSTQSTVHLATSGPASSPIAHVGEVPASGSSEPLPILTSEPTATRVDERPAMQATEPMSAPMSAIMPMRAPEPMPTPSVESKPTYDAGAVAMQESQLLPMVIRETLPSRYDARQAQRTGEPLPALTGEFMPTHPSERLPMRSREVVSSGSDTGPVRRIDEPLPALIHQAVPRHASEAPPRLRGDVVRECNDESLRTRSEERVPIRSEAARPQSVGESLPMRAGELMPTRIAERPHAHELPTIAAARPQLQTAGLVIEHEPMPHRTQSSITSDRVGRDAPAWRSDGASGSSIGPDAQSSPLARVFRRVSAKPESIQALVQREVQQALRCAAAQDPQKATVTDTSQVVITALRSPKVIRELMWQLQQAFGERRFRQGRTA